MHHSLESVTQAYSNLVTILMRHCFTVVTLKVELWLILCHAERVAENRMSVPCDCDWDLENDEHDEELMTSDVFHCILIYLVCIIRFLFYYMLI